MPESSEACASAAAEVAPALLPAESECATSAQPAMPGSLPAAKSPQVHVQPPVALVPAEMLPSIRAQLAMPLPGGGTIPASAPQAPGSMSAVVGPSMPSGASESGMGDASLPADLLAQVSQHLQLPVRAIQ